MDAISYVRISSKDQSRYSLEYQEQAIVKYCSDNSLNLIGSFKDNGESSYTFDRPDWIQLEKFIRKNKSIKFLIIYDHDRFSRNLAEALLKIRELYQKYGITVLATSETMRKIDTDDASVYITRAIKYMMGENELMRIRERTKAGINQAASNGYYTNRAPYGYKNVRTPEGKPTLEIDPVYGPVVKKIFKLSAEGMNPFAIRRAVKPLFKHTHKSAIQNILKNPVYMGMISVNAYRDNPKHYVRGKHKGIVSEALFLEAQHPAKKVKIHDNSEVPLKGVLKCWCGKLVTAGNSRSHTGKYYWYYLCNEHKHNLSAVKLHEQMNEMLTHLSLNTGEIELLKERVADKMGKMTDDIARQSTAIKDKLDGINKKIRLLEKRYLSNPNISLESYSELKTEMQQEKKGLEEKLALQSAMDKDLMNKLESMFPKLADLNYMYSIMDTSDKQKFLRLLFGDDLVYEGKSYRTRDFNRMFSNKARILNEKGLLITDNMTETGKIIPLSIVKRTCIELLKLVS